MEVFISALHKAVRQVKPDEAAEKPEVKEPKAAKAKKVVPTPVPEAKVTETKDKKPVKKVKMAKKKKVKG